MLQGRDERGDRAALTDFADHPPQRLPAARLPVGEVGGRADRQDAQVVGFAAQAGDGGIDLG